METRVNNKYKTFTSLEQSRKLAEILPLESADMYYFDNIPYCKYIEEDRDYWYVSHDYILAWSLAALLDIIRNAIGYTLQTTYNKNPKVFIECELGDKPYSIESTEYDNEVDACYEMIIKLKELNLL